MSSQVIFVVLAVLISVTSASIAFRDCGSKKGKISKVEVAGCTQMPCMLPKNTNVTFSVDFTASETVSKATAVVHGIIADIPVPFPIDHPDACKDCGLACPLKTGKLNHYQTNIFVKPSYPKIKVPVKWEIKDQDSNDVFCMIVLVQITDSPSTPLKFNSN